MIESERCAKAAVGINVKAKNIGGTKNILSKFCHPFARPNIKPAEALARGIPTCDNGPGWVVPMVFEICVMASVTQLIPFCNTI